MCNSVGIIFLQDLGEVRQPGIHTKRTVLNVFGPSGNGSRYILDSLKVTARTSMLSQMLSVEGSMTSCVLFD